MAWEGWFSYDGTEIINAARTEAYVEAAGITWLRPQFRDADLAVVLGHDPYVGVADDEAPWYDERNPYSQEFYGVYPLDVGGVGDSTRMATVLEGLGDGGVSLQPRSSTKPTVFSVLLIAASEAGAEYGSQWLKRVLNGNPCVAPGCVGGDLRYFAAPPKVGPDSDVCHDRLQPVPSDPEEVTQRLARTLRRVQTTVGFNTSSKRRTTDSGAVWVGQFTLTAMNPFEFSDEVPVVEGFGDPAKAGNPWVGGTPTGAVIENTPYEVIDEECFAPGFQPVYDPLAPAVVAPPPPPGIVWNDFDPPTTWDRTRFNIPEQFVPQWGRVEPIISFTTTTLEARHVRLRIYPDPLDTGDMDPLAPCDFVTDLVVAYMPEEATLVIDVPNRAVYLDPVGEARRRADSLVLSTNGGMFKWPELTCGIPYVVTVDTEVDEDAPYVDLTLVGKSA